MTESAGKGEGFPEDLRAAQEELLKVNARLVADGDDDGLMEIRDSVANDPAALRKYVESNARTKRLASEEQE